MDRKKREKRCPVPIGLTVQSKPEYLSRKNGLRKERRRGVKALCKCFEQRLVAESGKRSRMHNVCGNFREGISRVRGCDAVASDRFDDRLRLLAQSLKLGKRPLRVSAHVPIYNAGRDAHPIKHDLKPEHIGVRRWLRSSLDLGNRQEHGHQRGHHTEYLHLFLPSFRIPIAVNPICRNTGPSLAMTMMNLQSCSSCLPT